MSNLFSYKKVYKVNPDCDFPHVYPSKNKRPVEVKGTAYKTYKKPRSCRAVTEDELVTSYCRDWW